MNRTLRIAALFTFSLTAGLTGCDVADEPDTELTEREEMVELCLDFCELEEGCVDSCEMQVDDYLAELDAEQEEEVQDPTPFAAGTELTADLDPSAYTDLHFAILRAWGVYVSGFGANGVCVVGGNPVIVWNWLDGNYWVIQCETSPF